MSLLTWRIHLPAWERMRNQEQLVARVTQNEDLQWSLTIKQLIAEEYLLRRCIAEQPVAYWTSNEPDWLIRKFKEQTKQQLIKCQLKITNCISCCESLFVMVKRWACNCHCWSLIFITERSYRGCVNNRPKTIVPNWCAKINFCFVHPWSSEPSLVYVEKLSV